MSEPVDSPVDTGMIQLVQPPWSEYMSRVRALAVRYFNDTGRWFELCNSDITHEDDRDQFSFIQMTVWDELLVSDIAVTLDCKRALRIVVGLAVENHGCEPDPCNEGQYLKDAQYLLARVAQLKNERKRLVKAGNNLVERIAMLREDKDFPSGGLPKIIYYILYFLLVITPLVLLIYLLATGVVPTGQL